MRTLTESLRIVQGYFALAVGWIITGIMSLLVIALGWAYRLMFHWWIQQWIRNPFELVPKLWTRIMTRVVYSELVGVRVLVEGSIAPIHDDEVVVFIPRKHPSSLETVLAFGAITDIADRLTVIAKSDVSWLLRQAMKAMGNTAIFINRDNPNAWPRQIRDGLHALPKSRRAIVIIPETHRFKPWRLDEARHKFAGKIPGELLRRLQHCLPWRVGGTLELLNELDQEKCRMRVILFTGTFDVHEWSPWHVPRICGALYHAQIKERIEPLPRDPEALQTLFNQLCGETNDVIDHIITTQPGRPRYSRTTSCACEQERCGHH